MTNPTNKTGECCEKCKRFEQINDSYGVVEVCKNAACPCHVSHPETDQETTLRERFERAFPGGVFGTLSGDKNSPVFVNNDLEIPRLLTFIQEETQRATDDYKRKVREVIEGNRKDNGVPGELYNQALDDLTSELGL